MTIVLAIPTKDGLITASDGQITSGILRVTGKKIGKLNEKCLWGASGDVGLSQRIEESISGLSDKEKSLGVLRDDLSKIVRKCALDFLQLVGNRPISGDFLFAEYLESRRVLHISLDGTPEWIEERPFALGEEHGVMIASALFRKYQDLFPDKIDLEKGALLAFKVIEEVIDVVSYGVGPPIDIWKVSKAGIENLDQSRIAALEDVSKLLRDKEIQAFLGVEAK